MRGGDEGALGADAGGEEVEEDVDGEEGVDGDVDAVEDEHAQAVSYLRQGFHSETPYSLELVSEGIFLNNGNSIKYPWRALTRLGRQSGSMGKNRTHLAIRDFGFSDFDSGLNRGFLTKLQTKLTYKSKTNS